MTMSRRSFMASLAGAAALSALPKSAWSIPSGTGSNITGCFGPLLDWPIIPVHAALLPEGRVMTFGTDTDGKAGAGLIYSVWDPELGTGPSSHLVLPNTTPSDIFCSSQSVMTNGDVLMTGGDRTINGQRNNSINGVTIFEPDNNLIKPATKMGSPRWYPSLISLPNEKKVVFGGRDNPYLTTDVTSLTITPELRTSSNEWHYLTGAASTKAYGTPYQNWYYPRAHVLPGGDVGILTNDGLIFAVKTDGGGSISQIGETSYRGEKSYPTISYAPGKWFSMRKEQVNITIEFNGTPIIRRIANMDHDRKWANATIMADGRVFVNGGSAVLNKLDGAVYKATIWDPETEEFTDAAEAQRTRLYHSSAILLPDATILTGGGGANGPETNLNAEIFYPPYLYTKQGHPAVRPKLTDVCATAVLGNVISGVVGTTDQITRVTLVRTGASTHSYNSDQRFLELEFTQDGQLLMASLPDDPTIAVPGYWMMFAWNYKGIPSVAQITQLKIISTLRARRLRWRR